MQRWCDHKSGCAMALCRITLVTCCGRVCWLRSVCLMPVVAGKCCDVHLQHASADALAAAHHGHVCNRRHCHVLRGRAAGHCTSKTGCCGSKVGNPDEFLGAFWLNLPVICFNIVYNCIFVYFCLLISCINLLYQQLSQFLLWCCLCTHIPAV